MLENMDALLREYRMLPPGTVVLCAVSGGADSVCLLHRLCRLRGALDIRVAAAHYNHMLRGAESDRDEEFVREFTALCCGRERWLEADGGVREIPAAPLIVGRGDVAARARESGRGLEETAREMRYAFLRQAAREAGADVIATAHNAGDNGETVLLHLVRGTGLRGLAGIAPVREGLIRPLLTTSRGEIEHYLRYYGLPFMEDSSNRSDTYTRNRIRHQVIPVLEDICPGFLTRMTETAARLRQDEDCLARLAAPIAAQAREREDGLEIEARVLAQAHPAAAVRAARMLVGRMTAGNDNCTAAHLKGLIGLCRGEDPSARLDLPGLLSARREYALLVLTRRRPAPLRERTPLALPGTTLAGTYCLECREAVFAGEGHSGNDFFLSAERCGAVTVRGRAPGDKIHRPGRRGRSLKKLLIDEKIPLSRRDELPVLECQGQLAAVAGLGPDAAFLPRPGERAWHVTIRAVKAGL